MARSNRRLLLLFVIMLFAASGAVYWHFAIPAIRGQRVLRELIEGDSQVQLEEFRVDGQRRRFECTAAEPLVYLRDAVAQSQCMSYIVPRGSQYTFTLSFGKRSHVEVISYAGGDGEEALYLSIPEHAVERGWATHLVELPKPRPPEIDEMLEFLRLPYTDLSQFPGAEMLDRERIAVLRHRRHAAAEESR